MGERLALVSAGNRLSRYKIAAGLQYEGRASLAPTVSVKGQKIRADEIVRIARRFGVPVIEAPTLANALNSLEENEQIPKELYQAVAAILAGLDFNQ